VGNAIDPGLLVPGVLPVSEFEGETLTAEVLWIDRFGNVQLNIGADDLEVLGDHVRVEVGSTSRAASRAVSFDAIGPGAVGLIVDSYGLLALAVQRGSAAEELVVSAGDAVRLTPSSDNSRATTPVSLTSRHGDEV
jgi:S-adenosylmethionine hydrolase